MADVKELLYDRYIKPTENRKESFAGIEVELPIVNLSGAGTDHTVTQAVFADALSHLGFEKRKFDNNGICHEGSDPVTGDVLSFDCSYNNLEISFGPERSILTVKTRLVAYIDYLNSALASSGHIITGMGISPYYRQNAQNYIPCGRYLMLEGYLRKAPVWKRPVGFHDYPGFGTFASSTQVQLDVRRDELVDTIEVFSLLEPLKSLLFANSVMPFDEPGNYCVRDMLWEYSTHGINPRNIGAFTSEPKSVDEYIDYIAYTSIFCTEREGKYLLFYPVPFADYLKFDVIEGEYFDGAGYHSIKFHPEPSDVRYLRSYKFLDLTSRGTIEYRSMCTQPLRDALSAAAFQTGIYEKREELSELFEKNDILYHHGFTVGELRKVFNLGYIPGFIDRRDLSKLLISVVSLAGDGLRERGFGEESLIEPVYRRAETLISPARHMHEEISRGVRMSDLIYEYAEI